MSTVTEKGWIINLIHQIGRKPLPGSVFTVAQTTTKRHGDETIKSTT
jgi:hypothetical protein